MTMRIIECEQNSEEWFRARIGLPTSSQFHTVMAKGKDGGGTATSLTRRVYMHKLAGEILTGEPAENYSNAKMERGHEMEPHGRNCYAMYRNVDPVPVGFIVNDELRCGCSPDSLLGDKGLLEIKSKEPHLIINLMLKGEFPPEHKAQCQGGLWVAEREWIDLAVYWPTFPHMFIRRATRDNGYIANLAGEVARFNDELLKLVDWIKNFGTSFPREMP